ncbi:glucuronate isomerase, partial [bacterium]|nr:glucuronate isomerase [bacterium]
VFGIEEKLTGESAARIYEQIREKLTTPEFLPRSMFERFNIEILTTTDTAESALEHHQEIKSSDWPGRILPCFRPDAVTDLLHPNWNENIKALSRVCDIEIDSYRNFILVLENRREFFKSMGAVSTDHGVFSPYTHQLTPTEADAIFDKALRGEASREDADAFTAHMLMEMARMSIDDDLVMQIHPGSYRNHNRLIFEKFGPDKGGDIPVQIEFTHNLYELLNKYGNDSRLTLIIFTLDDTTYSRELAPLAGHYPALKLGPPWWFLDSIEGMNHFRQRVTETASIHNTVGFNDDTRAFPSIPARHDLSRRIDSNFLATLVAKHIVDMSDARSMSKALAYDLVKQAYKL